MKKIVRLTESELVRLVKKVINENENEQYLEKIKMFIDNQHYETALEFGKSLGLEDEVSNLIIDSIVNLKFPIRKLIGLALSVDSSTTLDSKNPQVREEIYKFIKSNSEFEIISDKENIFDRVYQKVSPFLSKENEDGFYDIQSVNCGNNSEERSGTVDIDDYGIIIIRYCEGNYKDLFYLKEKGKKLLQTKYNI